tara:strand:+ start:4231 stop:5091 length:861 start_codon:yes stop_codon:yes gene_type:complete
MIKFLKYLTQSIIIYFLFIFGKIIGLQKSQNVFSKIFQIIGPNFRSSKTISQNLEKFDSNILESKKKEIALQMWSNYGKTFIEYIFLNKYKKSGNHVEIINRNILDEIKEKNEQVIFVSGHFANYEIMSMEITKYNVKLATIYRPLNNYFLNPLMEYLRKKYVCKYQIKKGKGGVRDAVDYINKGYSIALMIDQRVSEGEAVDFFNLPALTTTLPAQLSFKYDLNLVPVYLERDQVNKYKLKFLEPIKSDRFKDKLELTKYLNQQLESMIVKNPGQWIWTHNRWKL